MDIIFVHIGIVHVHKYVDKMIQLFLQNFNDF